MTRCVDVAVVGGNIVGATTGLALLQAGLDVIVLEATPPRAFEPSDDYDLRVSAISRASQRIFESLHAWSGIVARRVSPYRHMCVWDALGWGEIHFDSREIAQPNLGHIIENYVIQDALVECLRTLDPDAVACPARLARLEVLADRVALVLDDGRSFDARLVVGADGAASQVRELAAISVGRTAYGQRAVVTTVATERPHESTAWQRFLPGGPVAFLPLADGRCSIVWSTDEEHARELESMGEADFAGALGEAIDFRLGRVLDVGLRAGFPLVGSQAERYIAPRVALVGDAAHTIHPLAGQGANLGLMDAAVLVDAVTEGRGRDPGRLSALRRYERSRRGENLLMLKAMEGFQRLFGSTVAPVRWVRSMGLNLTDRTGFLKRSFMRRAMGLQTDLPSLARLVSPD